jgi:hypothetical protein
LQVFAESSGLPCEFRYGHPNAGTDEAQDLTFTNTDPYDWMSGIFISYRQDDSASAAGRVYDRLAAHFGKEWVFFDIDTLAPGAELGGAIEQSVARSAVLIAVIGRQWLDTRAADGQRRLDDPEDYVRVEIRAALRQRKAIIPVLVQGARLPHAKDLPDESPRHRR